MSGCPRSVRDSIVGACIALVCLLGLVGYWAMRDSWRDAPAVAAVKSGGAGGQGGSGTGLSGTGPGAGLRGDGPGADPAGTSDELQGTPQGATTQTVAPVSGTDAVQTTARAAPEFGFTAPDAPQVAAPRTSPVPSLPIGTGTGVAREGASGGASPGVPEFMGVKVDARHVVYVLDFSGSMGGEKLTYLKVELKKSIFALTPRNSFQVILFQTWPRQMPDQAMLPGTQANTRKCASWVDQEQSGGGTNPVGALEIALTKLKPDAIYLLTDGVFDSDADVFALLQRLNPEGKVQICTIGFGRDVNAATLQRIASENRGTYAYVDVPGSGP